MIRQNLPCANSKINGCTSTVTQRGNILCEGCTEIRKNSSQNKKEYDFDQLMIKCKDTERELSFCKLEIEQARQAITQLEKDKITLIDDKRKSELNAFNYTQLSLDNQKLIFDNEQLSKENSHLKLVNETLSVQVHNQRKPQVVPQTSRSIAGSRIPELKRNVSIPHPPMKHG
jgi:hypothetical protein